MPNIVSFENIDEEYLILNVDKVKVTSPTRRILLLTEFIIKWNRDNKENLPISVVHNLTSLLDELQHNQIPISALHNLGLDDFTEHWQSRFLSEFAQAWSNILQDEIDPLEHKNNYINNIYNRPLSKFACERQGLGAYGTENRNVLDIHEDLSAGATKQLSAEVEFRKRSNKDEHVIFAGIHPSRICHTLIKTIYNLEFGLIVLPNLDLRMKEEEWSRINEEHHGYCLKGLLDYIGASREDVQYLTAAPKIGNKLIEYAFDLSKNLYDFNAKEDSNFEIITCKSQEEEAQIILMIIKNENLENVSLFVSDKLLSKRVNSLLNEESATNNYYLYITFLLYILDILTSNWGSVELLSLLKHPFIDLGYPKDEYNKILADFEIKILRNLNQMGIEEIRKGTDSYNDLEISAFFRKVELSFASLISNINHNISEIAKAHVECAQKLSQFLQLGNELSDFMITLIRECERVEINTLELYQKILSLLLQNKFSSTQNHLHRFSLHKNKVVILTNFNEGYFPPDFQNPLLSPLIRRQIGLPSTQIGYFQYILYNLMHAEKVYITRSVKGVSGVNRKPLFLQRLEMLIRKNGNALSKQPFREWLKLLTKPDLVIPCSRPKPKPPVDVRLKKLQTLSSTAVEKLIRNPYSFYAEYILDLKPLRELNFRPTIMHFGITIHKIFEKYLLSKNNSYEALFNIAHKYMNFPSIQSIWWPKFQKIAKDFFKLDMERRKNSSIVEVEKAFSWPLSEKITIRAKCDRIEHLLDRSIAIIDYKTGSLPTQSDVEMFFSPQLILQAITAMHSMNKEIKELMYWKFDGNQAEVFTIENHEEIMRFLSTNIKGFLSNFLNENVPFTASYSFKRPLKDKHLERTEEWL
ncbi:PD-(D/E)XK nuclease family protein [Candidatus Mesenet endosymbiont of Agriotes lineatus]|uniref:PD-(D/E)XK nuclease family protein n=1 Tax=Candidatus Mesenet endosymbiont of Agriotes lineatus TaxID=3077948 RepID=UPI0030CC8C61